MLVLPLLAFSFLLQFLFILILLSLLDSSFFILYPLLSFLAYIFTGVGVQNTSNLTNCGSELASGIQTPFYLFTFCLSYIVFILVYLFYLIISFVFLLLFLHQSNYFI